MEKGKLAFAPVHSAQQAQQVQALAGQIWRECYASILAKEQIEYMLAKLQSASAVLRQTQTQGYEYFLMMLEEKPVGYVSVKQGKGKLMLSKLYVLESCRGQGLGKSGLMFAQNLARQKNCASLWLTVNRQNQRAISIYKKAGFASLKTENTDIGGGFFMEDFVLEKEL